MSTVWTSLEKEDDEEEERADGVEEEEEDDDDESCRMTSSSETPSKSPRRDRCRSEEQMSFSVLYCIQFDTIMFMIQQMVVYHKSVLQNAPI